MLFDFITLLYAAAASMPRFARLFSCFFAYYLHFLAMIFVSVITLSPR